MNRQKSISGKDLEEAVTSDDLLGKEVIDSDGRFIGVAEKVFIHPETLDFMGISVDKGFLKKGLSIGKDFIEKIASKAIFLSISVSYEIKGLKVFDVNGKEIGKVSGVALKGSGNDIDAITVLSMGKKLVIPSKMISKIGYNVILNVLKQDVLELSDNQ